jgi:hypothetical protein
LAKVWVLDTSTKGTGAEMVPLEKTVEGGAGQGRSALVLENREKPRRATPPEPKGPRRFKVVDVMTRQVLAGDAPVRETVGLLEGIRSIVDVSIYVWEDKARAWQQVSQREKQMLWGFRGKVRAGQD